jgi:hypothetical protein
MLDNNVYGDQCHLIQETEDGYDVVCEICGELIMNVKVFEAAKIWAQMLCPKCARAKAEVLDSVNFEQYFAKVAKRDCHNLLACKDWDPFLWEITRFNEIIAYCPKCGKIVMSEPYPTIEEAVIVERKLIDDD